MNFRLLYERSIGRVPQLKRLCQYATAPVVHLICRARGWSFTPDMPLWSRLTWALGIRSREDQQTFQDYRRLLRQGDIVLDVGANFGIHTREFAKLVGPTGRVFAFEPTPAVFECLSFNTQHLSNCSCVRKAVYSEDTTLEFGINKVSCLGNSLAPKSEDISKTIPVEAISLDSWSDRLLNTPPRLIKVDVEGAETAVLAGATQLISRSPDAVLIIEYCPSNMRRFGITPNQFYAAVNSAGLKLFQQQHGRAFREIHDAHELETARQDWEYINVIAAHKMAALNLS